MRDAILVTGGAGFIGSNFVLSWLSREQAKVICLDLLTYAGNLRNLTSVRDHSQFAFVQGDIADSELVEGLLRKYRPRAIVHFAAESHVDRSILGPEQFIRTNIEGTFKLLEQTRRYWAQLPEEKAQDFRFLHVSTDEVYGSLGPSDPPFHEATPYAPNSPYAASKASSDHLVRAYFQTYKLPTIITNCSNNYGPYQFPEKLIPLIVMNALREESLPVYGDGLNVRDWLYVEDHCSAIRTVLKHGRPGETYNVGGGSEKSNIEVVKTICRCLDEIVPRSDSYERLIRFVADRPGHDRRYAVDSSKLRKELDWSPQETFDSGLRRTVKWYVENRDWVKAVQTGEYRSWLATNYKDREKLCEA